MNTAELLKKEIASNLGFTKEDFITKVCNCIKSSGYYACYHGRDTHFNSGEFDSSSISIVLQWAREEGFKIEREVSCYGIPNYFITL